MTLTLEQQQALDELLAHTPLNPKGLKPDLLKTFLGLSGEEIKARLLSLLARKDGVEQWLLGEVERNPLEASFEFMTLAALAFYTAEKDINPKIKTFVDAFYYISTCASVGYADIFAVTQTGRAIAAVVMIVGPALAAKSLDRGKARELPETTQ